ncbi:acetylcholinesterase-1-like [Galendromus occidentalis]|uniref:acetylcholinesterase n=1 Tax=Galendromus occidentalis TaxID=34638 RepID=A0AAJ6QYB4_9ACAR|nr:acetylcholinesterase-1-like [Galendromus occidentalis]
MKSQHLVCVIVFAFAPAIASEDDFASEGTVKTVLGKQIRVFLGIPYARPPEGKLRFRKPQPVNFTKGLRAAKGMAPSCLQLNEDLPPFPWLPEKNTSFSEDCLYLNVWTPLTGRSKIERFPVLIFLHGGGFRSGSSSLEVYDGGTLSAYGDLVVVTVNYRLGSLGFLQLNSKISGNMGLYDQVRALEWTQLHIGYFGGDPSQVTVMGQEAGAVSLGMLLLSPLCKGLLKQAVLLSGAPNWLVDPMDTTESITRARKLASEVGCVPTSLHPGKKLQQTGQCLMKVNASSLVEAEHRILNGSYYGFLPRQRDMVVPMDPVMAVAHGHVLPVDVLVAFTEDEGYMQTYKLFPHLFTNESRLTLSEARSILAEVLDLFPDDATDLLMDFYFGKLNDSDPPNDIRQALSQAFGDIFVTCPARIFAESFGDRPMNAFLYEFKYKPLLSMNPAEIGATNFDDIPYLFGEPLRFPERFASDDVSITKMMMNIVTSFVKSGTPEPVRDFAIPKFESPAYKYVQLSGSGAIEKQFPRPSCDLWKRFYPKNS